LGLIALTGLRLWAAAVIPLTEDEAYYRLWAASPQLGYFDHPPMIAWWIAIGERIAGDTPLGVRLISVLSCLATSLLIADLARTLGWSARIAGRAALWTNATFLIGAGGVLAVPDAACTPFWTLTLCCLARTARGGRQAWWVGAGVAAGLACLSKYSALFLAPGALLCLATRPDGLKALRRPWPWLAALAAALVFAPNVIWNATHHWLTFTKQFGRAAPGRFAPRYLLEFVVGQALLLNPAITVFAIRALGLKSRDEGPSPSLPLATTAPFLAYLTLHALHDRVQAHWPVPVYPALALCAAAAADTSVWGGRARPVLKALRLVAAPLGLGLSALALIHLALPTTDLKGGRDPAAMVRDWPRFARSVETVRTAAKAGWVGVLSYGTAGQLANQSSIKAPVVELLERERYPAGDPSWRADLTAPGLVVDLRRRIDPVMLGRCFGRVTYLGPLIRDRGGPQGVYAAYWVSAPRADVLREGCPLR
jgi:4-amino-4-deoxy-L-arabinose transferase-like glycosyltransferase